MNSLDCKRGSAQHLFCCKNQAVFQKASAHFLDCSREGTQRPKHNTTKGQKVDSRGVSEFGILGKHHRRLVFLLPSPSLASFCWSDATNKLSEARCERNLRDHGTIHLGNKHHFALGVCFAGMTHTLPRPGILIPTSFCGGTLWWGVPAGGAVVTSTGQGCWTRRGQLCKSIKHDNMTHLGMPAMNMRLVT